MGFWFRERYYSDCFFLDELKKIFICPRHCRKCSCLGDQCGPCQHPFHQENQEENQKLKKPKKVTADVSDSIFQEFGIVIPIASHKYPSVE